MVCAFIFNEKFGADDISNGDAVLINFHLLHALDVADKSSHEDALFDEGLFADGDFDVGGDHEAFGPDDAVYSRVTFDVQGAVALEGT